MGITPCKRVLYVEIAQHKTRIACGHRLFFNPAGGQKVIVLNIDANGVPRTLDLLPLVLNTFLRNYQEGQGLGSEEARWFEPGPKVGDVRVVTCRWSYTKEDEILTPVLVASGIIREDAMSIEEAKSLALRMAGEDGSWAVDGLKRFWRQRQ